MNGCLASIFLIAVTASLHAEPVDVWTGFRGKDGQAPGDVSHIPAAFTVADYRWKVDLPGRGHSSPVVWKDRVFITAAIEENEYAILCFDSASGKERWRRSAAFTPHHKHKFNEFASCTPCLDDERLYIVWSSGEMLEAMALTHDGEPAWHRALGPFLGDHGSGSSPVMVNGKLFVYWDHVDQRKTTYEAIDPASGETVWQETMPWPARERLKSSYSTPLIYENRQGKQEIVINSMAFGLQSLDPETGDELWRYDHQPKARTVASPVAGDGVIFATWGSGNGAKDHVAVIPGTEAEDGKARLAWRRTRAGDQPDNKGFPYVPTPLIHEGLLYLWADSGLLQVVEAATGTQVYGPERVGGEFYSNPLLIGDRIFCGSRSLGEMVVAAAGPEFQILARNKLGSPVNATPAVADGRLFIRTASELICLGK